MVQKTKAAALRTYWPGAGKEVHAWADSDLKSAAGGSVVKTTACSSKGLQFDSQHPHDRPLTNICFRGTHALFWPLGTHVVHRHTQAKPMHIK